MKKLILASASPRRQRLVAWLGVPYEVEPSSVQEELADDQDGPSVARRLALEKARQVAARHREEDCLTLGFDTVVALEGRLLGKPAGKREAASMLRSLSSRAHKVTTGVAVVECATALSYSFAHTTEVRMKELGERDIERWLQTEEALGCAGAYNIERHLAAVDEDECFQNVAGLPLCHLYLVLKERFRVPVAPPRSPCERARDTRCELGARLLDKDGCEEAS